MNKDNTDIVEGKWRDESEIITDRFAHITIYGMKFTAHHNDQLMYEVRKIIIDFLNWLHSEDFKPIPHKPYKERKWWKDMDAKEYSEVDLFYKYIKKRNKEWIKENSQSSSF